MTSDIRWGRLGELGLFVLPDVNELGTVAAAEGKGSSVVGGAKSKKGVRLASIGAVAEEFGFTTRALRLYEEKKLVAPRRIGNRRVYSERDRRRLEVIAEGKRIGLALDDIKKIIDSEASDNPRRYLEIAIETYSAHIAELKAERKQLEERLRKSRELVAHLESRLGRG